METITTTHRGAAAVMKLNPGSDAAIDAGCTCPVVSNAHGKQRDGIFTMTSDCPLHGAIEDERLAEID